jgi:hypothetical protein
MSTNDPAFQLTDHRLAGMSCRDWETCCCTPCLARKEIVRLRAAIRWALGVLNSEPVKRRMYAGSPSAAAISEPPASA